MPIIKTLLKSFKRLFKKKTRLFKIKKRPARFTRPKRKIPPKRNRHKQFSKSSPKKKRKKLKKIKKLKLKKKPVIEPQGIIVGEITHFFSRIQVVVIKITKGSLKVGDRIQIKGRRTNFNQIVESIQIESVDVKEARQGQLIGLKAKKKAREGDKVFKLL